jgi:hypothetical protein
MSAPQHHAQRPGVLNFLRTLLSGGSNTEDDDEWSVLKRAHGLLMFCTVHADIYVGLFAAFRIV